MKSKCYIKGVPYGNYRSTALITGAAGGMGKIYAILLAENGYNVIMADISRERLEDAAAEVRSRVAALAGERSLRTPEFRILTVVQDLSETDAAEKISSAVSDAGLEVDILINNAGLFFLKEIAASDKGKLSAIMMVHNYTPLMLCREFVPRMIAKGQGRVLNISSLAAWMNWPALGMYANTKRFVKDYSRSLRIECRGTGVSVTTAYFGAVDTPLIPLKPSLRKLARRLGVMISAERATDSALSALFRRKKGTMPGVLNKIFLPVAATLPDFAIAWIVRKLSRFIMMDV